MASVSRLNLKTVLIISLLLVTLSPSLMNTPIVEADGEGWLDGWTYRKEHNVTGSTAGAQTDYQRPIKVYYGDGEDYFAENGVDDPLYTANYPRAQYYNGRTYFVWQGESGYDPYIAYYDHTADQFSDIYQVGTNPLTDDYHGAPSILIDKYGYIHVFFGAHHTNLEYVKSTNPEDITAWTVMGDPTGSATYPNVIPDDGDIHLIYRHTTGSQGDLAYRISTDNGTSWSGGTIIIEITTPGDDSIYAYHTQLDGTNLSIVWRYYDLTDGHHDIFYAYLNLTDSHMYNITGADLGVSITEAEADASCQVVNSGALNTQGMAQRIDENGYPYILYGCDSDTARSINFTRWDGASWVAPETIASTDEDNNIMDFILHSSTSITAFLVGNGSAGRGGDIDKWTWDGATWTEISTLLSEDDAGGPLGSPKVPVDYVDELKVIFAEYGGVGVTGMKLYASDGDSLILREDGGESVYLHNKSRSDFGDIRFTDSDGETELEYKPIEEVIGDYALFYVLIPSIPAYSDEATIYIYYGNDGAASTADGEATFPWLFDDFDDYSVDDSPNVIHWRTDGVAGGNTIDVQADPANASQKVFKIVEAGEGTVTSLNALLKDNRTGFAIHFRTRGTTDERWYYRAYEGVTYRTVIQRYITDDSFQYYNGGDYVDFTPVISAPINTWFEVVQETMDTGKSYMHWEVDGVDYTGGFASTPSGGMDTYMLTPFRLTAQNLYVGGIGTDNRYIFVRNFVTPEPSNGVWGSEETEPAGDPTVTSFVISDLSDGNTMFKTLWYRPVMVVDDSDGLSDIGTSYFSFETDYGWHNVSYNYQTDVYAVETETGMIMVANGYTESSGTSLTIHFYLYLLESIDVKNNVDVYCRVTDTSSGDSDWSLEQSDYFNILDYVEDIGGSGTTTPWTPTETPSEEPQEIWIDSDGDGIPNWDDPDVDGDWVPNEFDPDIDGDDIPNELDPEPFIPYVKPDLPVLLSFKTPSGVIINIINPMYYLKPYQKIIIPFIFILLAMILIAIYSKQKEAEEKKGKIEPQIRTGGYGKLEKLRRRK